MSRRVYFITHPDVVVDPDAPVPRWRLSERGRQRMRSMLQQPWIEEIDALFCSGEQKAIDGATILAERLGIVFEVADGLGENDRSSTGYLPNEEFQAVADEFFAKPYVRVRGWERAADAQSRIVTTIAEIAARTPPHASIAIVSHGGVGTLLQCAVKGVPISRLHEQPGKTGGNFFIFDLEPHALRQDWRPIDT